LAALLLPLGNLIVARPRDRRSSFKRPQSPAFYWPGRLLSSIGYGVYAAGVAILLLRLLIDVLPRTGLYGNRGVSCTGLRVASGAWSVRMGIDDRGPGRVRSCRRRSGLRVVEHEAAHLERHDIGLLFSRESRAPFTGSIRWLVGGGEDRLEADRACDDAVPAAGLRGGSLMPRTCRHRPETCSPRHAPAAVHPSQLERASAILWLPE